jgi:exoribonuclease-2
VLRIDGMPFITRLPGLPDLPRGQQLELDVLGANEIDLALEARVHQVLAAQATVDPEDVELIEDAGGAEVAGAPLPGEPQAADDAESAEQQGAKGAAPASEDPR